MTSTQTTVDYDALGQASRLLIEAVLKPVQGHRFQPTGFANLGAARYRLPDETEMLLVDSAQSVANRLEKSCWDFSRNDLIPELDGLPYIRVFGRDGNMITSSIMDAHRMASIYVLNSKNGATDLVNGLSALADKKEVNPCKLAEYVFKYDPSSLIHGAFFSEIASGRLRLPRLLSGFIEARGVIPVESGGAKHDSVDPSNNVLFGRTEFVADEIKAFFNFDLTLLRNYNLSPEASKLLIALSLFKIRRFLSKGLRLRTACDFQAVSDLKVTCPQGFVVPDETVLLDECKRLIRECGKMFVTPCVTKVVYDVAEENQRRGKRR